MQSGDDQRHIDEKVVRLRAALAAADRRANWLREEVRAAEQAKNEFLANISHEVRTPMNAILGFSRVLLKDPHDPSQTEKLQYIHGAAECLLQLINNAFERPAKAVAHRGGRVWRQRDQVASVPGATCGPGSEPEPCASRM